MKIMTVVGARPNFMKAAPLIRAIENHNEGIRRAHADHLGHSDVIRHTFVHTGQHYSELMSDLFLADLKLPSPDVYLGIGSGSHAEQTGKIMSLFEQVLLDDRPDAVIVVGDVNSTLACALVTAKIAFDPEGTRPLLAHVEAGLRSFDRSMPEEHNRVLTDHLADLLFVTEESGIRNLQNEGIGSDKIFFVGNTMIDCLIAFSKRAESSDILDRLGLKTGDAIGTRSKQAGPYAVLTLHRAANVDSRSRLLDILAGLDDLSATRPVVFPCHPRSRKRIQEFGLEHRFQAQKAQTNGPYRSGGILLIEPLGYLDFLCLLKHAALVLSDSGGVQEETTYLGVPCVTIRENTERPATVTYGSNVLAGVTSEGIREAIAQQTCRSAGHNVPEKWDGNAASRVVEIVLKRVQQKIRTHVHALSMV